MAIEERKFPSPVDGIARTKAEEAQLDRLAFDALGAGPGAIFMEYLRGITLRSVCGPGVADQELRHREGARHLVSMIEARLKRAKEKP